MKKIILLTLLLIFFISSLTIFLILFFLDPYRNETISLISIFISCTLFITSFLSIFIYFIKKVYYRWEVSIDHVFSSLRQWFLINAFIIWLVILYIIWVFWIASVALIFSILVFSELLLENF